MLTRTYCGGDFVARLLNDFNGLQRQPTTKTPWLGLETPARTFRGGDFVARLLDDFNGGRRPRPRG